MTAISPKFTSEIFGPNPDIDAKIRIFEDRELGWRFSIAQQAEKIPHAGYALISMLFAYFEMIAQYSSGTSSDGHSKTFFRSGVRTVYPTSTLTDAELNTIYRRVRCGMYHSGYTKLGPLISGHYPEALSIDGDNARVNPHRLLADLTAHFTAYVASIRDANNVAARTNFNRMFDAGTA